ncbi:MAG: cobalt-precorrin-5B (C(1))-methyltransferase CbiD [Anaerovoracaceae bacterium]|nr:cobalt-precorrin-5B (C(1))-methyltransferase CbiD [Anaerovoracaceae bacterium]
MREYTTKNGKKMRRGYTTGVCAAAAVKASAEMLLTGAQMDTVDFHWRPSDGSLAEAEFPLEDITRGDVNVKCAVRKDAGDDPDATDGMLVYAEVYRKEDYRKDDPDDSSADDDRTADSPAAGEPAAAGIEEKTADQTADLVDVIKETIADDPAAKAAVLQGMSGPDGVIHMRWNKVADFLNEESGSGGAKPPEVREDETPEPALVIEEDPDEPRFIIKGGQGVGIVTKPGLDQPAGSPAINSGPRRMIREGLEELCGELGYEGGLVIVLSIPGGEKTAEKTFNPVVGVEGGLSILGTTGIVEPMSGKAVEDTVRAEIRVKAASSDFLALVPGNAGHSFAAGELQIPDRWIVTMSNYPGASLDEAMDCGVKKVLIIGSLGKLVKLAGGIFNTHSHEADARIDIMMRSALRAGASPDLLLEMEKCVTTDAAADLLEKGGVLDGTMRDLTGRAADHVRRRVPDIQTEIIILKNTGEVLGFTDGAFDIAEEIMKLSMSRVYFVGAGSGAPDLITVRGMKLLEEADVVIYAGSLVNPELLDYARKAVDAGEVYNSAELHLEQIIDIIKDAAAQGKKIVRLHTGDPSIYGAIREQMDQLDKLGITYEVCPGVSSFSAAAAALNAEYTLPGVSQTVILTRMEGRTPVPENEKIRLLAAHGASMAIFLSASMTDSLQQELLESGGYTEDTPCAIVYKASWPEEKKIVTTLGNLAQAAEAEGITKTALILVGGFLGSEHELSKLYDKDFHTEFR